MTSDQNRPVSIKYDFFFRSTFSGDFFCYNNDNQAVCTEYKPWFSFLQLSAKIEGIIDED